MKRLCLICTLILFSAVVCASSADVTFSGHSVNATVNDNGLSYYLSLKNTKAGLSFSSPATFSFNGNGWYAGEIRPAGIFQYTLNINEKPLSVGNTKAFQKVVSPALNPSFTSIARSFDFLDIAAFYPYGIFADLHNKKAFVSAVIQYNEAGVIKVYQPDWNSMPVPGINVSCLAGYGDSFRRGLFGLSSFCFLRTGNNAESGYDLSLSFGNFKVTLFRRLASVTSDQPVQSIGYSLERDGLTFGIKYEQYAKAVFGGTVQKKSLEMEEAFSYGKTTLKVNNRTTGDEDAGRSSTSEFDFVYDGNEVDVNLDLIINRIAGSPLTINKLNVKLDCSNAMFCINGTKFELTLSAQDYIKIGSSFALIKYSVDQDRTFSINARFTY